MSAIETADSGYADSPTDRPSAGEVTGWLLEGRWFTIDTAGAITSWSPAAAERFGWQRVDVSGESFAEKLVAPDDRSAASAALEAVTAGGAAADAGFTRELDA